jgi:hypothetical protein
MEEEEKEIPLPIINGGAEEVIVDDARTIDSERQHLPDPDSEVKQRTADATEPIDLDQGSELAKLASLPLKKSPGVNDFRMYESQNHWSYLNLLQKQLDILRDQMAFVQGDLVSPHASLSPRNESPQSIQPTPKGPRFSPSEKPSQSIGTNTSLVFLTAQPQKILPLQHRDMEIQANMDTTKIFMDSSLTFDRPGTAPYFESSRRLPIDSWTHKPFCTVTTQGEGLSRMSHLRNEISVVSGHIPYTPSPGSLYQSMVQDETHGFIQEEDPDTPETSFSKNLIVQMVSHPEKSFIVREEEIVMETSQRSIGSQFLPDSLGVAKDEFSHACPEEAKSSLDDTPSTVWPLAQEQMSFASWDYLKRHGLVDGHGTGQDETTADVTITFQ